MLEIINGPFAVDGTSTPRASEHTASDLYTKMSRQEAQEFNVVGLQRSPVKRTPRGCLPTGPGESLSGATTARMSMASNLSGADSVRSVGSSAASTGGGGGGASASAAAAASGDRRHHALQPMAANSIFDNSTYSSGSAARTPLSSVSPLDKMSSAISSKKEALVARRSGLPVSRTLKLSPSVDTAHQEGSATDEARAAAAAAGASMLCSHAGDHTHRSMTRSALFSALGHLPSTPGCTTPPSSNQEENASPPPSSSKNHRGPARDSPQLSAANHQDQPSTPAVALGETDFLDGGNISNIDDGRSHVWSDCSFTNAVFSPDPATPTAVAHSSIHGGSSDTVDRSSGGRGGTTGAETSQATGASPVPRAQSGSSPAGEVASCNRTDTANGRTPAATPAAVAALLRMGECSMETDLTPGSGTAASRYRGYVAHSPIAVSTAKKECEEGRGGVQVPSTPAAAATLAAMMMGANATVAGSGEAGVEEGYEDESLGKEGLGATEGNDENRVPQDTVTLPSSQVCLYPAS